MSSIDPTKDLLSEAATLIRKKVTKIEPLTEVAPTPTTLNNQALILLDKALNMDTKKNREVLKNTTESTDALFVAFKTFEEAVGGREALLNILGHCPLNSVGYNGVMKLITDPKFIARSPKLMTNKENIAFSLSTLCKSHKLPFNLIVTAFRDAKTAMNAIEALTRVSTHAPKVVDQLILDSTNRWEECPACHGKARVRVIGDGGEWAIDEDGNPRTSLCYNCRGEGVIWKEHDFANRQKFLEISGILKKEPLVQQNFDQRSVNIGTPDDGSYENLMKKLDNIARGRVLPTTSIVDAEVIDVQSESNS